MKEQPTALWLADALETPGKLFARHEVAIELRRLYAENEMLRADAERYRWLRDPNNAYRDEWNYFGPYSTAAEIDAAIDAGRSET